MTKNLKFFQDAKPHPCSYLSDQQAQNIYPDPNCTLTNQLYSNLIAHGFRRSGNQAYRPFCPECQQCVPVRIVVNDFKLSRSHKRCLKRNEHLTIHSKESTFNPEHFELYQRYLASRHIDGGMDNPTEESYNNFLMSYWSETSFIEVRDGEKLVAVAVTDHVNNGLSAFYTFFDPSLEKQSLGTYAILQQINLAKAHNLSWLYLGYWIEECQKMRYKQQFSALEGYTNQQWQALNIKNFEK
jgi:arginyl-tRNA--protein-N-Asp/Glu arginylyltransferase